MTGPAGFRLSPQQRRLWQLQSALGERPLRARARVRIRGPLDPGLLRAAVDGAVSRYEILRTTFPCPPGLTLPVQQIADEGTVVWHEEETLERDPFDFARGPLLRLALTRIAEDEHVLTLVLPALCADAATLRNLVREISGEAGSAPLQYVDLAEWQNELLETEETAAGREHWEAWDPSPGRALRFPFETAGAGEDRFAPRSLAVPLEDELVRSARALAAELDASLPTLFLAAWQTLLWRLAGQPEIVLGLAAECRSYEGLPESLGPLASFVPLSCRLESGLRFTEAVTRARDATEAAAEWQEYFRWESVADRHGLPLAETVFPASFVAEDRPAPWLAGPLEWELERCEAGIDRFRLLLAVHEGEAPEVELAWDAAALSPEDAAGLARAWKALLASAVARPEARLDELALAGPDGAGTVEGGAAPALVHELFRRQVERVPDRPAVVCGEESLSYAALAGRADRLARLLRGHGVGPDGLVAVCLERSLSLPLAILGVLAAGGAYLPLEPGLPRERKAFLLGDARPRAVLTETRFLAGLPAVEVPVVCLDGPWEAEIPESSEEGSVPDPANLVYVIYTSGSTGAPKGVAVEHRQLANYVQGVAERLDLPDGATYAMVSTFAADLGNTVLFPSLCGGGTLHLIPEELASDPVALAAAFERAPVDCLKITPSHLEALLAGAPSPQLLPRRCLVLGGEASRREWVEGLRALRPGLCVINHYGPTETTVGVLTHPAGPGLRTATLPLGRPLPGTAAWLLGADLSPLPPWFPGELYLGGAGVARGYLNRPGLTAERFVPAPLAGEPGARMYRTGDLARRLPEGTFEFIGRADHQVKIRGFRIELGEVEAALEGDPEVRRAAVAALEDGSGSRRLVAYIVAAGGPPDPAGLRGRLQERLPEPMVPSAFLFLDALPLNANGKLDRRALPEPDWRHLGASGEFVAPETATERLLSEVWAGVLGLERVGAHDNFFHLGGDSIRGIVARARAEERGVVFTIEQIFDHPVLRDLARVAEETNATAPGRERTEPFALLAEADRARLPQGLEDAYPLARLQAGMLFHSQAGEGTAIYHDLHSVHVRAPFRLDRIHEAVRQISRLHPVLRTSFDLASFSEPLQLVHPGVTVPVEVHGLPREEPEAALAEWLRQERRRAFDWTRPPLVAFHVHPRGETDFQFTLSFHHAILDGWSSASLLTDLFRRYARLVRGEEAPPEPPLAVAYRDFIALERAALSSAEARDFWGRLLDGAEPARLPRIVPPAAAPGSAETRNLRFRVDPALSEAAHRAAQEAGVPLKSLLLAIQLQVSSVLGGTPDVLTALVSHGRPEHADGERALGLFLNTLPLRLRLRGASWTGLAREVFDLERRMLPFRRFPFAEMQRREGGRLDLEIAFNYLHYHVYQGTLGVQEIEVLGEQDYEETNFPLVVHVLLDPLAHHLWIHLGYRTSELDAGEVQRFGDYLLRALAAAASRPASRSDALLLTAGELAQVLGEPAAEREPLPAVPLHRGFERQAAHSPGATALVWEGRRMTYGELDAAANRLARHLRSLGVGLETRVTVLLERSTDLVVALLAVLKAGGAYVPVDPASPAERIAFLLTDSGSSVLVTAGDLAPGLPASVRAVRLDADRERIAAQSGERLSGPGEPASLAYVIYTSGSTGRPKGVQVTHANAARLFAATEQQFRFGPADVWTFFHSAGFDFSVWEIWGALLYGGRLVIAPHWVTRSPEDFHALLATESVTVLNQTPSAFQQLAAWEQEAARPHELSLRLVIFGGEALHPASLRPWLERHGDRVRLVNMYGITETTVHVTFRPVTAEDLELRGSPIGSPIEDLRLYLLAADGSPVPVGVPGEIHVGGAGLARGYLGRPELTAERFLPDAFGGQAGGRLYRSGDLARRLPGGGLEYLGRIDHQVKIRGFRIELGEIEAALVEQPGVGEAVVVSRQDGSSPRLVAYVVPAGGEEASPDALREALLARLPAYMVPAAWVVLPALPLTANGKVDRRSLPAPEAPATGAAQAAPQTPAEQTLAAIWAELLRVGQVGLHDNFFALGGDSILSIQICARAQKAGLRITPRLLFEHPTVAELAAVANSAGPVEAEQGLVGGPVPLTPIQRWFFADDPAEPHHFNQAVLLETRRRLDPARLEAALGRLERHHDALRLRFDRGPDGWRQTGAPPASRAPLTVVDLAALPSPSWPRAIEAAAAQAQSSLDLERGPLHRALLLDLGPGERERLFWTIHHLAVDGVSWRFLLEDLNTLYDGFAGGRSAGLPAKTTSFRSWAERLAGHAASPEIEAELPYWLGRPWNAAARLPLDRPEGMEAHTVASEESVSLQLSAEETRALLQEVPQAYNTQINDALLAALALGFQDWTGSSVLRVDLEGHGREEIFAGVDLSRTAGWFTSLYPVLLDLREASGPGGALKAVKELLRQVPQGGLGYGLLRWSGRHAASLAALPPSEVVFNYLGQLDQALAADSPFQPAREPGGPPRSPRRRRSHLLAFNGSVFAGRLGFACTFSRSLHRRATIERLVEAVTARLRELIAHCRELEAGGYTPSDFPLADLSAGQLEKILAIQRKVAQP
ncbi:MAG TPA: amino acid adenylation domain-containing protein [Thermoanaerobaculia bacterium]|nr:amino acid adenylation domain-containing protein [Thermoanaerobaculia bacterium]